MIHITINPYSNIPEIIWNKRKEFAINRIENPLVIMGALVRDELIKQDVTFRNAYFYRSRQMDISYMGLRIIVANEGLGDADLLFLPTKQIAQGVVVVNNPSSQYVPVPPSTGE